MKVALTGHTSGIGKAIYDKANEIVEDWVKKRKEEKMQGKTE